VPAAHGCTQFSGRAPVERCIITKKLGSSGRLGKLARLVCVVLTVTCAIGSPPQDKASTAEMAKWQALIPTIKRVLMRQGDPCRGYYSMQGEPVDATDLAGNSFALVDVCPLGAYTELIIPMQLEAGQPVVARFRNAKREVDLGFARGASVMHGVDVKLAPENNAVYDIHWDNDGLDNKGIMKLEKCIVDAYVWKAKSKTFDWDAGLTKRATRSYCRELQREIH
jgi:hypothetical protein